MKLHHFAMLICAAFGSTAAFGQPRAHPYLEIGQVVTADLEPAGSVFTYSSISAGVDVSQKGPRSIGQASYRYERVIGWGANKSERARHLGLARGQINLVPGLLDVDGGALATQVRSVFGAPAPIGLPGRQRDLSQLYSIYGGLRLHPQLGLLSTQASYTLGYSHANIRLPGQGVGDAQFGNALAQDAAVRVGMAPGPLPFGWSLSANWAREDQSSNLSYFIARGVRGDVLLPLLPNLAVTGGIGQDWAEARQKISPGAGSAPRLLYDFDGRSWDVGFDWRPSLRTSVRARYGERRGSTLLVVQAHWQPTSDDHVSAFVYDEDQSFAVSVTRQMSGLPTQYQNASYGFFDPASACAFGVDQAGGCLNGAVASPRWGLFRARGAMLNWSRHRRRWTIGLGVGGVERDFLDPRLNKALQSDQIYYGQLHLGYALSPRTDLSSDTSVSVYHDGNGMESESARTSLGLVHYLSRRWTARGQLGAVASWAASSDLVSIWGQAALRYAF